MFGRIENPVITGVFSGESTVRSIVKRRNSHLFIYKVSGESIYYLRGNEIKLSPGSVLYVPEGEGYSFEKISEGESQYYLINFHASFENCIEPMIISYDKSDKILKIFKDMERLWRIHGAAEDDYEIISLFYHLLAKLIDSRKTVYLTQSQKDRIEPAIIYLEKHIYDTGLKMSDLSKLCEMSDVMFRRIFNRRFATSPKKYIIQNRMQKAKMIFENGEFESVEQVARDVGYDDPLHFSKYFKAIYGGSPTKFSKKL